MRRRALRRSGASTAAIEVAARPPSFHALSQSVVKMLTTPPTQAGGHARTSELPNRRGHDAPADAFAPSRFALVLELWFQDFSPDVGFGLRIPF